MILTCPACSTRYMTDEGNFTPHGRTVRCAKCGNSWFQNPPSDEEDFGYGGLDVPGGQLAAAATAPRLMRPEAVLPPRKKGHGVPAFIFAILAVVALIAVLYQYRNTLVSFIPGLQGAYEAVGAQVGPTGLDIRNVKIRWADPETRKQLEVWGEVVNLGHDADIIPLLRFSMRDSNHIELYSRTMALKQRHLVPGASSTFFAVLEDLPEGAVDITVDFADSRQP